MFNFLFNNQLEIKNLNEELDNIHEEINNAKEISFFSIIKKIINKHINNYFIPYKIKKKTIYVINFMGDLFASEVEDIRIIITSLLDIVTPNDEVIIILESLGGSAYHYGLATAQLERLRNHNINLTIIIDRFAASGGYLMACVANKIIASPFSLIGSIGVISIIPNIYNFLKKHDINVETYATSKYKGGISIFNKITEEGRHNHKIMLNNFHNLFKSYIQKYRPLIDIEKVSCGKVWLADESLKLNLIDEINISDQVIMDKIKNGYNVLKISLAEKNIFTVFKKIPHILHKISYYLNLR